MKSEIIEQTLIIYLEGRIDSSNAAEIDAEIMSLCDANEGLIVTLDAEKLEYISSAGLRILMKLRKKFGELTVLGVSPEVYEIFDVTGFTEILTIKKALRHISVENCEVIGEGANGKVYRLDKEMIIKVFKNHVRLSDVERELTSAKNAFITGIPTAISYDVVKVGDDFGVIYEMLDADILGARMMKDIEHVDTYIDKFIDLALQMHHTDASGMNLQSTKDTYYARLPKVAEYATPEQVEVLRGIIEAIPESKAMIHGDFHTKNVMVQGDELILIDMGDLSMGHPMIEVANCYSVFQSMISSMPERAMPTLGISAEIALKTWARFSERYFKGYPAEQLQLIDGLCKLLTLFRAVMSAAGKDDIHHLFVKNLPIMVENAETLKYLMKTTEPFFK